MIEGEEMPTLLQFNFGYPDPFGPQRIGALKELARSIAEEPGCLWKIWIENGERQEGGGIYLFADEATATAYLKKHTERLGKFGATGISAKMFDVNEDLTQITRGPIAERSRGR
jgi:hypothetical protein